MLFIRQGATHKVVIGPVVAVANGYVPVTTLSLATADEAEVILHDNGTVVDISGYTMAAITTADGYYHLTLQSGISGTVGHMTVVINDDSLCLPVKADFTVVEEAVYDMLYAASAIGYVANQPVDLNTIKTQTVTCAAGVTVGAFVGQTTAVLAANASGHVILQDASLVTAKLGTFALAKTTNITGFNDIAATAIVSGGAITTSGGIADANVQKINDVTIVGDGSATPFNV